MPGCPKLIREDPPGYSWPPHLYQAISRVRGEKESVNHRFRRTGVSPRPGLEFEGFQGRVLRSNQKFTAKGELSRTPTQRFFGAKPRQVRIVVFLRDVRQNQVAGPAVEALGIGKKFAHGVI